MSVKIDLIIVNLGILFLLTILSLISGNNFIANAFVESQQYSQILNGTTSTIGTDDISANFSLDPLIQAIAWISVIGIIAIGASVSILATGLNESGTRWTVGMIFFVSIWTMLSTLPYPLIMAGGYVMELIYLSMTILYAIGCIWLLIEG